MITQISGKYSREDNGVFVLKRKLIEAGMRVTHPISDQIIGVENGVHISFNNDDGLTLLDVELDYYTSIKTSSFHIVCNQYKDVEGYIGRSVSLEIAYAMIFRRPIVLLSRQIVLNENVDTRIADLIMNNKEYFVYLPLNDISQTSLLGLTQDRDYHLNFFDEAFIIKEIEQILRSYKRKTDKPFRTEI